MEDRRSWDVKNEAILDDLAQLMKLNDEETQALTTAKPYAEALASQMIDAFYDRLLEHDLAAEYVVGMVSHLRVTLEKWFLELFSGKYDRQYFSDRLAIGQTHVRVGLPVRYPLAMMDLVMEYGEKAAAQTPTPELAGSAFRKIAALDIAIFNQAYENTQLEHLSEMVGNERLARRLLTQ